MLFPILNTEAVLQVNDKTRLSGINSFASKNEAAIDLVEIEPEAGFGFIDITGSSSKDWYLDWAYSTDGEKVVTLRVSNGGVPVTTIFTIKVLTAVDDALFSSDSDLISYESEVLRYVVKGRSSYLNIHRQAQVLILKWINDQGYCTTDGEKITKAEVVDKEEVREWSAVLTLRLIYSDLKNSTGDEFKEKSDYYNNLEKEYRDTDNLRLDFNKDGEISNAESVSFFTRDMVRR